VGRIQRVAHTRTASKVPEITAYFWGIKILTTGMGETTSESIHSIHTRRRELFYWAAVLVTSALGTAAGDMTAFSLNLGFLVSGLLFAALFVAPAIGHPSAVSGSDTPRSAPCSRSRSLRWSAISP
jgi:uncharacterized membrane-anchored protein